MKIEIQIIAFALAFVLGANIVSAAEIADAKKYHIGLVTKYAPSDAGIAVELSDGFAAILPAGSAIPEAFRTNAAIALGPTSVNNGVAIVEDDKTGELRWRMARICAPLSTLILEDGGLALGMDPTPSYYKMDGKAAAYAENAARAQEAWANHDRIDVVYDEGTGQGYEILHIERSACRHRD